VHIIIVVVLDHPLILILVLRINHISDFKYIELRRFQELADHFEKDSHKLVTQHALSTTMLFSNVLQPPILSLFSSTGSNPMQLWDLVLDSNSAVPTGSSCIQLIHDSTSSSSLITPPSVLGSHSQEEEGIMTTESRMMDRGYELDQTVLHIQSPNLSKTFIQCPPRLLVPEREVGEGTLTTTMPSFSSSLFGLGLKYPCIHLHVRNMGKEWSFEVGIMDTEGRLGVLRLSTFQVLLSCLLIVLLLPS